MGQNGGGTSLTEGKEGSAPETGRSADEVEPKKYKAGGSGTDLPAEFAEAVLDLEKAR